ncbi:hypothetical protein Tco_0375671 [Tanacetum coccineum]
MDTLSMVSKYLNDLEEYLDDGDSMEAKKITVKKSEKELEMFEALGHKTIHEGLHALRCRWPRSLGCGVGHGGFSRAFGDFGRDFLVTSKTKVDFGSGEMRIDLTMLEEEREMNALLLGLEMKSTQSSHPNPLIANYKKQNGRGTIEYQLQQIKNANLKWRELPSMERHAYCESFDETLKELMTFEHLHSDADVFVDYECLLTISLDNLCLDNLNILKEDLEYWSFRKSLSLYLSFLDS